MRVLQVISRLPFCGAARQLGLVSAGLPAEGVEVEVCVLGKEADGAIVLGQGKVPVHILGGNRGLNLVSWWGLRQKIRSWRPDVIHAWNLSALRTVTLTFPGVPMTAGNLLSPFKKDERNFLNRWFLSRPARILARGLAEVNHWRTLGLDPQKIVVVPPGVADRGENNTLPKSYLIACAGFLEAHKGFRDAIWTLDILGYLFPDVRLLVLGDGPARADLERFVERIGLGARVEFLGSMPDVSGVLARAAVVWVPTLGEGGRYIALEAMAMGKPVVASNLPHLREIVIEGQTGFLFRPGDKVALARRTREILDSPELARRLGEAGRRRARENFSDRQMVTRLADLYRELAA